MYTEEIEADQFIHSDPQQFKRLFVH